MKHALTASILTASILLAALPAAPARAQSVDACSFDRRERLRVLQDNGIGLTLGDESARLATLVAQARARKADGAALAVGALTGKPLFFLAECDGARCTAREASRAVRDCEERSGGDCVIIGLQTAECFQQSYFPTSQGPELTRPAQTE